MMLENYGASARKDSGIYAEHTPADADDSSAVVIPYKRLPIDFFKNHANRFVVDSRHPSSPSLVTNSSQTFYSPVRASYPHTVSEALETFPVRTPSSSPSLSPHTRRELRYTAAQSALACTLTVCNSEPSAIEQQILALQRAATFLGAQAQDARESAEKLRQVLSTRDGDVTGKDARIAGQFEPSELRAMQRERWLAERRCAAREEQCKAVQGLLTQLIASTSGNDQWTQTSPKSSRSVSRRKANLTRFFERSPTRLTLQPRAVTPVRHMALVTTQRRKTVSQVRALRLRTSACAFAAPPIRQMNSDLQDGVVDELEQESSHRGADPASSSTSLRGSRRQPASSRWISMRPGRRLSALPEEHDQGRPGTAFILPSSAPRTRDEILAQLDLTDESIPNYAVSLLDDLVASELDVKLELPTRSWSRRTGTQSRAGSSRGPQTVLGRQTPRLDADADAGQPLSLSAAGAQMSAAASTPAMDTQERSLSPLSPKTKQKTRERVRRSWHLWSASEGASWQERGRKGRDPEVASCMSSGRRGSSSTQRAASPFGTPASRMSTPLPLSNGVNASPSVSRSRQASNASAEPSERPQARPPSRLSVLSMAAGDFAIVSKVRNRLSVLGRKT